MLKKIMLRPENIDKIKNFMLCKINEIGDNFIVLDSNTDSPSDLAYLESDVLRAEELDRFFFEKLKEEILHV